MFLAEESFVSKIPPYLELLQNIEVNLLSDLDTVHQIMHVPRIRIKDTKLKTWDEIITDMNEVVKEEVIKSDNLRKL